MPQLTRTKEPNASTNSSFCNVRSGFSLVPCVNNLRSSLNTDGHTSNGGFSPGVHLFPFRTESLSPGAPMVLPSSVGESVAANLTASVNAPPAPRR